jgi:hypothetical protein
MEYSYAFENARGSVSPIMRSSTWLRGVGAQPEGPEHLSNFFQRDSEHLGLHFGKREFA